MGLLIFYGVISIAFSFLCSILEAVLLSITPTFINVKKNEGKAYAETLEEYKQDVDKPLIAILTINTIAHTVGAILVGSQAKSVFEGDSNMIFIISSIMTVLILVASEIIPKTIGATYWKSLAGFTATTLKIMIFPLRILGILWLLRLVTKLVGNSGHGSVLSRQDFGAMAQIGEQEGTLKESESKIINNILAFDNIQVKDIMTPRTVVQAVPKRLTLREFHEKNPELPYSRILVYENDNMDNIVGFMLKDEFLLQLALDNHDALIESLVKPIEIVKDEDTISGVFDKFLSNRIHIALVTGKYGMQGVLTMEDIMETLLGEEIMDESDNTVDLQKLALKKQASRLAKLEQHKNK